MAFTTGEKMISDEIEPMPLCQVDQWHLDKYAKDLAISEMSSGIDLELWGEKTNVTTTPIRLLKFVSKEEFMKEEFQSPDILTYKLEEEDKINAENT